MLLDMNKEKIQIHIIDNIRTDIELTDAGKISLQAKLKH